ncbi:MAG: glycine betaine ABC transporter substrate-binding protein, partial [Phycisphaerae bacterium]
VAVLAGGILPWRLTVPDAAAQARVYCIGAKNFTEQFILASLLRDTIQTAGMDATKMEGLGSVVAFEALANGDVDVYVDYSGTVWANYMKRTSVAGAETVLREMTDWLAREKGILCLGPLGFENAYALAMRRERAEELGIRTIADLGPHAPRMTIGGDYEFFGRPEWQQMRSAYGLRFAERKQYQSTFMYEAVATGEVDVISAFSSDGRIAAYDLVVLDDPKHVIPPYDAVVLVSPQAARDRRLVEALRPLLSAVRVEWMREANLMVDRDEDKRTVDQAAAWLRERLAGPPSAK